ncbi:MAG TPA: response regulator transcription factor [Polaromonas sp.]|nr:response regulator transcription factor [Polaromonas sp.]
MYLGIVEDDPDQLDLLTLWAESSQHKARGFANAHAFMSSLGQDRFDLILIDWMLPDSTGLELVRWIREHIGWETPVMVFTSCDDESTVVAALEAGADDYLVKSAGRAQLSARVAALARRIRVQPANKTRVDDYEYDLQEQSMTVQGQPVTMTNKEFELAVHLLQNPGKLLSRDHLLDKIWGINSEVDTRTIDTHVSRIRKKLSLDGTLGWKLTPVYRVGYRLDRVITA